MRETSHPIAAPVRGSCRSVSSLAALPRPFARTALSQPSEIIPGGDNNYLFDPKTDSSLRFRAPACAPFGFGLRRRFPSSSALRCIPARPPKFLTELSRRVVLLCPAAPARPKPIRALGVGFTASELLATRNSSNETLRRRFICIATHLFVRQDSRIRVAPLTACRPNHISVCL